MRSEPYTVSFYLIQEHDSEFLKGLGRIYSCRTHLVYIMQEAGRE